MWSSVLTRRLVTGLCFLLLFMSVGWFLGLPSAAVSAVNGAPVAVADIQIGHLVGTVTYAEGGAAANIHVLAYDATTNPGTYTDVQGHYDLDVSGISAASFTLYAYSVDAYHGFDSRLITGVTGGRVDLVLPQTGGITGRVLDAGGNRIPGAMAWIQKPGGIKFLGMGTDSTGTYRFSGVEPGPYLVSFTDSDGHYQPAYYQDQATEAAADTVTVLGGQTTTLADVSLTAVNDAPVANGDSYTATESTVLTVAAAGVLSNDTDANLDGLTAIKVTDPAHGSVSLAADGSFVYTPAAGYSGPDSFTYQANDGTVDSNVATVDITVTATYTLTYTAGPNGTITGISPQTVASGANGSLVTAVPDPGYHFSSWSDGVSTAARTDLAVTGNITATATFQAYNWGGFLSPLRDRDPRRFGLGSTIPVKFVLLHPNGPRATGAIATLKVTGPKGFSFAAASPFSYSPSGDYYQYNLQTGKKWAPGTYTLAVSLDGSIHTVQFVLKD